jgi:hypothetical protein
MPDQQAKPIDPDKVSRVARKSPVDGLDMQRFFGTYLRPKALIDLPPKICKEGTAVKPRSMVASDDLGLPREIIEAILSHLPIFDLIVAARINMTFRTIVQNSPMLQRKLSLRPTQKPTLYVQVEHPAYGCRTLVAEESSVDVDEHDDSEDSRDEHDGEAYASDDPEQDYEWQWSFELAVVDLCPFLLHDHGKHNRSVRERVLYRGGEKVHFSRLAALAEHWANMYLTNPPCKEVIAHVSYHNDSSEHISIIADRTVYCESGVTAASLLDVLNMEGEVNIVQNDRWLGSVLGDLLGVKKDTTISREIEYLEDNGGFRLGKTELDWVETVIEFPGVVFREWRAVSREHYFRSGENYPSYREYQVTAEEEALHG